MPATSAVAMRVLAAVQGSHLEAASLLITLGADVNAQDDIQDSAFLLAGARGHAGIVRQALDAGADVTATNRYGGTALIPACHYGHVETVRVLLTSRIAVDHVLLVLHDRTGALVDVVMARVIGEPFKCIARRS